MYDMENERKGAPQKMIEKSRLGNDFSIIFRGVHFLLFSMSCIFHSFIFQVYFFCHFPVVTFLSFSGVCIFYLFPCCTFSILCLLYVCQSVHWLTSLLKLDICG